MCEKQLVLSWHQPDKTEGEGVDADGVGDSKSEYASEAGNSIEEEDPVIKGFLEAISRGVQVSGGVLNDRTFKD